MLLPIEATEGFLSWVKDRLEERGWSMREASLRSGLSNSRLSQIMNGDTPGIEACIRLANVFDESPARVLHLAGYIDRDPGQSLPFELEKIVQKLEMLKGSGMYDQALRLVDMALDTLLYKLDLPEG